jgi:ribosomal 50S subunit-recycling heat shock protein
MRLDLFLKASRLVLRRKVAQELCEAGAVTVNGAVARPARTVRVGDVLGLRRRDDALLTVRITALPAARQTSKQQAATLYEIVSDAAPPSGETLIP